MRSTLFSGALAASLVLACTTDPASKGRGDAGGSEDADAQVNMEAGPRPSDDAQRPQPLLDSGMPGDASAHEGGMSGDASAHDGGMPGDAAVPDAAVRPCSVTRLRDAYAAPPGERDFFGELEGPAPSRIGLLVTARDCQGRALAGLTEDDLAIVEETPASSQVLTQKESGLRVESRTEAEIFVSVLVDMNATETSYLGELKKALHALVDELHQSKTPLRLSVSAIEPPPVVPPPILGPPDRFQGFRVTPSWARDAIDGLKPSDDAALNLLGGVARHLERHKSQTGWLKARNAQGALPQHYVIVVTDGRDTAGASTREAVAAARAASAASVYALGLSSASLDEQELKAIAPDGVWIAATPNDLLTHATTIGERVRSDPDGTYFVSYCSPKRDGSPSARVVLRAENATPSEPFSFDASGWDGTCAPGWHETVCAGKQCGGIGCGVCDDRVDTCDATSSQCVSECVVQQRCNDTTIQVGAGYSLTCPDVPQSTTCGLSPDDQPLCRNLEIDPDHCGACDAEPCLYDCQGGLCATSQEAKAGALRVVIKQPFAFTVEDAFVEVLRDDGNSLVSVATVTLGDLPPSSTTERTLNALPPGGPYRVELFPDAIGDGSQMCTTGVTKGKVSDCTISLYAEEW